MCRHLAYLGPSVRLSRLLFEPAHSLAHQSWAPREMRGGGTINVDGFGVGWYADAEAGVDVGPLRYRRDCPIWADTFLPGLARETRAPAVLAAVRAASAGMPVVETACAPFTGDGWLFSLNGRVVGWPESVAPLARRLPVVDLLRLDAPVDSALVWALVRHRLRGGADPAEAVADTVADLSAAAPGSRLNLLLAGPRQIVATALGHSLSVRAGDGSVLVSSEPLDDDPAWRPLSDGVLVVATPSGVDVTPLPRKGDPP
jgi:glutamine amidotransferase